MSYDHPELGSGQVEYTRDRPIIHFGSPDGSVYETGKPTNPKPSVKDWINGR
jgi:hypothetical protein